MTPITHSFPHPFISIISISKGKKLLPRVARHCHPDQILTMLTMLVANFEFLDVCRTPVLFDPVTGLVNSVAADAAELFMNTIVPPMLAFVVEAPFRIVIGLMALFLDRNDVVWVARSKVGATSLEYLSSHSHQLPTLAHAGLAFLTMFLSRAEMLKQGAGALQAMPLPEQRELTQWQELYTRLFATLQTHFLSLFPPVVPVTALPALAAAADDMYVWQFLAAMAVGASMEQQHVLVTEVRCLCEFHEMSNYWKFSELITTKSCLVSSPCPHLLPPLCPRERVLENVVVASNHRLPEDKARHKIANVNLFLHALGLDASQVAIPAT
ncbi:topoisomerase II-associated protein PAT1-domain-containing protein [Jimgerdemannia flammicorona]|uniref:Topoisomerase II-associated protein PAT1-domain-containing protein n=1 Tax=Jimgerdemannia flammicorona TaxID=994334 RepID=A0A433CQZ4_9FUNG|nr:topoisomerase II-associated protein PAT1-domain-containing protein [Jimgerdemannia flammicorona]